MVAECASIWAAASIAPNGEKSNLCHLVRPPLVEEPVAPPPPAVSFTTSLLEPSFAPPVSRLSLLWQLQHRNMRRRRITSHSPPPSSLPKRQTGQVGCSLWSRAPAWIECCIEPPWCRSPVSRPTSGSVVPQHPGPRRLASQPRGLSFVAAAWCVMSPYSQPVCLGSLGAAISTSLLLRDCSIKE